MGNLISRRGRRQVAESSPLPPTLPLNNYTASPRNQHGCLPDRGSLHATKKAVLIGIRYEKARWPLKGSKKSMDLGEAPHDEVQTWRNILTQYYGYGEDEIICMQDTKQCSRDLWPNRENIIAQLEDLVRGTGPGDRRFLFIAGHGDQRACTSDQTELDGKDEIFYTLERNKKTCGIIKDNELRRILADRLPPGANLTVVLELCNSGTMMDLPFRLNAAESGPPTISDANKKPREHQGNILCLSACEDSQQAYDFQHSSIKQGILTTIINHNLSTAAARSQVPTLRVVDLLKALVGTCKDARGNRGPQTPMVTIGKRLPHTELERLIFQP